MKEQVYRWTFDLEAPPEALWPLVSDTDRFNRDCGYPSVEVVAPPERGGSRPPLQQVTNARRLRARVGGIAVEWDELPFEWLAPRRFAVDRRYHSGPLARLVTTCELEPRGTGTRLVYELRALPSGLFGRLGLPFALGRQARARTAQVFRAYDRTALAGRSRSEIARRPDLAPGGADRAAAIARTLVTAARQPEVLVGRLSEFVTGADDLSAARMRPYELADQWNAGRRPTLLLFLQATRAGLLDFSWELICPHCRGAQEARNTLAGVSAEAHCPSCDIDFTANFDQSVELSFSPNASVRKVERATYCVGGPRLTPHVVAQQLLPAGGERALPLRLDAGRYRVRAPGLTRQHAFRVVAAGPERLRVDLETSPLEEPPVSPRGELVVANGGTAPRLAVLEHLAWSDQSVTAAEVTSLQLFRDLFSREVLRPGEKISVGSMTVVFTDLKNSTRMYREIGDAPAFGRVLTHFELLKASVAAEGGCIVKTMGDAIMAVFPRSVAAVRAVVHAQRWLANPLEFPLPQGMSVPPSSLQPLALKAGIHAGPCLAINQNDRLDYFGTTVNTAARLCGLCTGSDVVLSESVHDDPEVAAWLEEKGKGLGGKREEVLLKGLGDAAIGVWRMGIKHP